MIADDIPPCPKCGSARIRLMSNGKPTSPRCRPCLAKKALTSYHESPEASNIRGRAWREANKERQRELQRRWREANPERILRYNRSYYVDNRESEIQRSLAYTKAHPEVDSAIKKRREARKRAVICEHGEQCVTAAFIAEIRSKACQYCGKPSTEADHFDPLVRGGLHCRNNIVPACKPCNTSKWAHDPVEWMTGRASRALVKT